MSRVVLYLLPSTFPAYSIKVVNHPTTKTEKSLQVHSYTQRILRCIVLYLHVF